MIRATHPLGTAVAVASSAGLYTLVQPDWGLWPLSFVCLVPLLLAFSGRPARARLWLCVAMANVTALLGTADAAARGIGAYFELSPTLAALGWLGLAQVLGSFPMLVFALLCSDPFRGDPGVAMLRVSAAWVAAELMRSVFLSGMPWFLFAYGVAPVPVLAQAASLGGVLLVSGLLMAVNMAVARVLQQGIRAQSWGLLAGLGGAVALWGMGVLVPGPDEGAAYEVVLVQGPVDAGERRGPGESGHEIERLGRLSAAAGPADLVIWPENAANAALPWNAALVRDLLVEAAIPAPHLIVGAPFGSEEGLHTSAVLISPARDFVARHDKVKLVPFGEFTPWPLTPVDTARETLPGHRPVVLEAGALRVGPLICYEVLFGGLARSLVADGANVLANLSNDGWFQHQAALEQHLAAGVYRAIETRRPMLRATRTGITASIDARGRVQGRLPEAAEGVLHAAVVPWAGHTPYGAGGFVFPWVVSVAAVVLALRRRYASRSGDPPVY